MGRGCSSLGLELVLVLELGLGYRVQSLSLIMYSALFILDLLGERLGLGLGSGLGSWLGLGKFLSDDPGIDLTGLGLELIRSSSVLKLGLASPQLPRHPPHHPRSPQKHRQQR